MECLDLGSSNSRMGSILYFIRNVEIIMSRCGRISVPIFGDIVDANSEYAT